MLPQIMEKLEKAGARRLGRGPGHPTGYSFNLDGANIYMMTLATLFLAQATNTPISLGQELALLGVRHGLASSRRLGRHGRRLHHPGRDPGRRSRYPDRGPGRGGRGRPVHERVPGPEPTWSAQRGGHPGRRPLGRRPGPRPFVARTAQGEKEPAEA
ncbi:cation:dicarboxylate symporter family transporter [Caulobacter segnis]